MSTLRFKRFAIHSFGGINKENPIIIIFPEIEGPKRKIGVLRGDQGVNKSSTVRFLLYAAACNFDFKLSNFVNLTDKTLSGEFDFDIMEKGVKKEYRIRFTKTKFELLKKYSDGENSRFIPEDSPKETVQKLIGYVATSPMELQNKKGKEQVDWLFDLINIPAEIIVEQTQLEKQLAEVKKAGSKSSEEYKRLKKTLAENDLYSKWEECEKKFKEEKTIESVKNKLETATKNKSKYEAGTTRVAELERGIKDKGQEIDEIKIQIENLLKKQAEKEKELVELNDSLETGEKWLIENVKYLNEFDSAQKEFMDISEYIIERSNWLQVVQDKKSMDEYENLMQRSDALKDDIRQKLRGLINKVLPDIPGLEVITDDSIDGKEIGLYIEGKTPAQLCESELFDLYFKLCQKKGIRMAVIENVNSLGTHAVETLNRMSNDGVQIWCTEMQRGLKDIKIEFIDEIV